MSIRRENFNFNDPYQLGLDKLPERALRILINPYIHIVFLFISAYVIRSFRIDYAAPWQDELHSITYSRNSLLDLFSLTRDTDIHPPLYFSALKAWFYLFGEHIHTARLFSAFFGSLLVVFLYSIAKHMFGQRVAFTSAALLVVAPLAIHYSREIRMYAFYSTFFMASFYCFLRMMENAQRKTKISANGLFIVGFALCLSATFYIHYTSVLLFICYSFIASYFMVRRDWDRFFILVIALFLATILVSPQLIHMMTNSVGSADKSWMQTTTLTLFYRVSLGAYPFPPLVKLGFLSLMLVGLVVAYRKSVTHGIILFSFIALGPLVAALIGVFEPIYLVRTIQVFTLFAPILLALSLTIIPPKLQLPSLILLLALSLHSASDNYLENEEVLFIDAAHDYLYQFDRAVDKAFVVEYLDRQAVYRKSQLYASATKLFLDDQASQKANIANQIDRCLKSDSTEVNCRSTVIIVEIESKAWPKKVTSWMTFVDQLAEKYPNQHSEYRVENYRIFTVSTDQEFLSHLDLVRDNTSAVSR